MTAGLRPTHWVSVAAFLATAYLVIFAEARFDGVRKLLGTQIHLLPGMLVYAAISFNVSTVIACATIVGLLFDILSANPMGTTSVAGLMVTFGMFHFRELLLREQLTAQFVLGAVASAVVPLISVLVMMAAGVLPLIRWGSVAQWVLVTAGGAAFTPLWFLLFNWLDRVLRYKEVTELSFRQDRQIARGKFY